jgi:hypothetical protein
MNKELKFNKILNVRMEEELVKSYQEYCENNGLVLSKRVRFIIRKDMEGKLIIK